jgi:hypothetical protein
VNVGGFPLSLQTGRRKSQPALHSPQREIEVGNRNAAVQVVPGRAGQRKARKGNSGKKMSVEHHQVSKKGVAKA